MADQMPNPLMMPEVPLPPEEVDSTYAGKGSQKKYVAVAVSCVVAAFLLIVVSGTLLFSNLDLIHEAYGFYDGDNHSANLKGSKTMYVAAVASFSVGAFLLVVATCAWFWGRQQTKYINKRSKAYVAVIVSCVVGAFVLIVLADTLLISNFDYSYTLERRYYIIEGSKAQYLAAAVNIANCALFFVVVADALLYFDWDQTYAGSATKGKHVAAIVSCSAVGAYLLIILQDALLFPDWKRARDAEEKFAANFFVPPVGCAAGAFLLIVVAGACWIMKRKTHIDKRSKARYEIATIGSMVGSFLLVVLAGAFFFSYQGTNDTTYVLLFEEPKDRYITAAVSFAVGAFLLICVTGVLLWTRQQNEQTNGRKWSETDRDVSDADFESNAASLENGISGDCRLFHLSELRTITNKFSEHNKLGEGGFGPVYKGMLQNRKQVAVKTLAGWSKQGYTEFKNEVDLLAKLKHKNLVQLLGYCLEKNEKMLCYEYLPSGSLDWILFATDKIKKEKLNWETRYKIIEGISCGLQYLHIDSGFKIIHRDLKPSNILLDANMTPKISDFGLARLYQDERTHKETSIIAGTYGYMAPEYAMHGMYSEKVDVYSFGIMVLEIVTGRKSSSFCNNQLATNLISHAWHHWEKGELEELKDPALDDVCLNQLSRCIHIALLCVQESPINRPNMDVICFMLHNESIKIPGLPSSRSRPEFLLSQISMSSISSFADRTRSIK